MNVVNLKGAVRGWFHESFLAAIISFLPHFAEFVSDIISYHKSKGRHQNRILGIFPKFSLFLATLPLYQFYILTFRKI